VRIEELYLDGFGHFHQRSIGPLAGPVTVFYGPNEAGKSTTLAFIRAVLFGFPARFNSHYPPLAGGRHGGRITVSDSAGAVYGVERYAGARGGLYIAAGNGPASNADALLQRLTGNATPDLFRNVFAFSLDELQAFASLSDSSGAIYSAVQGAPGLPALRKSLSDHKGQIYLSRGVNQEVPRLLNALRDVDGQLRAVEGNAGRYGTLTARKSEIGAELREADAELERLNTQRAEIKSLLDGWEDWIALSTCETQLRDMPRYVNFPDNPIPRLESIEERIRQSRELCDEAAAQLRQAEEAASVEIPDENLLYDKDLIEVIRRTRGSFDDSVKDLPERKAELNALESAFQNRLRDIGPGWDESRLQTFDTSIAFRQEVETGKAALTQRQDAARRAEQRLEQEQRSLTGCETAAKEAQERLTTDPPPLDAAGLSRQRAAVRAARQRLNEYERARQNHENLRGQLNSLSAAQEPAARQPSASLWLPTLLSVVGIFLIVAGIFLGSSAALVLGIIGGLALLGAAAWLLFRNRAAPVVAPNPLAASLARQSADAESSAHSAYQSLIEAALPLSIDGDPTAAALDDTEERLDEAQAELSAWNDANGQIRETQRRLEYQQREVESAAQQLETAANSAAAAQQEWQNWLERQGLPAGFTPDTVVEFMGQVETGRARLEQVNDNRRRASAIEYDIQQFQEQVEPLAARHGLSLDPGNQWQLALTADELIRRLEETQSAFSGRERAKEQTEETRQLLESRERRLQLAEEELAALLAAGGADGAEDFRRRARQHEERLDLERRRDEHRRNLEWFSRPGQPFDAFRTALAEAAPDRLGEESARLSELHAEVDVKRSALREERGGIDTELAQLTSEEESSALRIRRSTLEERLREHAREWSRLTIAEALLEKTRQKFERERQPSVIRYAEKFFSGVTGQRYQRLYAPVGEQTITVTDAAGASKQHAELSRGTREQLYLALRFGLIREFGEHAERLPVVVDEALVNFDPERARLAAESFAQLAETNQVLVFTCHPSTAGMFADAAGAQVVDISG
jgi:uncharacterized protein YhaN